VHPTTIYAYDATNRKTRIPADPVSGAGTGPSTTYSYDANSNLTQITDPLGHVTQTHMTG